MADTLFWLASLAYVIYLVIRARQHIRDITPRPRH